MERYIYFIRLYLFKSPEVPHFRLKPYEINYLIWKKEMNVPSLCLKRIARAFQQADLKTRISNHKIIRL